MPVNTTVHPGLTPADRVTRRKDLLDTLTLFHDVDDAPFAATGATQSFIIPAEKFMAYRVDFRHNAYTGYAAGTVYWQVEIQASPDDAAWTTISTHDLGGAQAYRHIPIEGSEVEAAREVIGNAEFIYLRLNMVQVGAPGPIDIIAYLSPC